MLIPKDNITAVIFTLSVLIVSILVSCTGKESDPDLKRLDSEATLSMSTYAKDNLDSIANLLLDKARSKSNKVYEGKAHFYLSSFKFGLSETEKKLRLRHLDIAEKIADATDNDTLRSMVYNQRGVWELAESYSPATAQYWFSRSIEIASRLKKRFYSIPAEMNMSEACRMSGDTIGIRYDRNLFDYAMRFNESLLKFTAGLHCASYYSSIVNDTSELSPYIGAMRLMEKEYPGAIEMIYAKFFYNKGRLKDAERYIRYARPENYPDFQILYAEILSGLGRFRESEHWTEMALPSRWHLSPTDYGRLLRLRASNMEALGNHKEAYARATEYEAFRDSLEQTKSLDLMKRYRIEYEVAAKDREISEQRMRIRSMVFVISAIVVFVVAIALGYYLWHRRRNRFYKDIVRQNREFIDRQDILDKSIARRDAIITELENRIHELQTKDIEGGDAGTPDEGDADKNEDEPAEGSVTAGGLSDERSDEIFDRIRNLTDKEQVWRDTSITREAFARMAGCNRTYFTEVLKARTGMGYSQYMNSCRVREAVRVLSDPNNSIPLKELSAEIGFLTIQTFYSAFRQQIGMSPAAFRKAALADNTTE